MRTAERFTFGTTVYVEMDGRHIETGVVIACDEVGITIARQNSDTRLIPWGRIWNVTTLPTLVEAAMTKGIRNERA